MSIRGPDWSVAPDQTWIELNRALTYVIVLCLALALGASDQRSAPLIAKGFLLVAPALTGYGLGQKLMPGLHVAGVLDLNQTGSLPRLREPFGYWNALALFIASRSRWRWRWRSTLSGQGARGWAPQSRSS